MIPNVRITDKKRLCNSKSRLKIAAVLFFLAISIEFIRLLDIMIIDHYAEYNIRHSTEQVKKARLQMLDRNGVILATDMPSTSLYAIPKRMSNAKSVAEQLAKILKSESVKKKILNDKNKGYILIKRHLEEKQKELIANIATEGLEFRRDTKRVYIHKNLLSHVLGYTDVDSNGISGLEYYISSSLKERKTPIILSIDIRIQRVLHDELENVAKLNGAKMATGIVMDVRTGEIIAMASVPDFDPNKPQNYSNVDKFNMSTLGVYELGSICKIFTMASAIDSGVVKQRDIFDVSKNVNIGEYTVHDYKRQYTKSTFMSVEEILYKSSNIGMALIAEKLGKNLQFYYLRKMGLFNKLKIEIPEKSNPILPETWSRDISLVFSYGYGMAITPLHAAQAISSIVNGGLLVNATLLKKTKNAGSEKNIVRIISTQASKDVNKMLSLVVKKGTGRKAKIYGYPIGGKTGTAEKIVDGKYSKRANVISFVGTIPSPTPDYLFLLVIDEPKNGSATGGSTAAPAVARIIKKSAPILGIIPTLKR